LIGVPLLVLGQLTAALYRFQAATSEAACSLPPIFCIEMPFYRIDPKYKAPFSIPEVGPLGRLETRSFKSKSARFC